ncbi:hypothetical protein [Litoreibacter janthinus]|uniref:Phytanoyl-CoA dioxygenase (PhyH) n=1 Tax=Litoreibacter janthinus TaxID=670154 RepID=A0A1I6GXJ1_9RHOB|nr:hypothetical protein [Litoreibacter janthinus]SFR46964.1 hypothetical protein SAMN04488002_2128 [Litoreibacter janthinus]
MSFAETGWAKFAYDGATAAWAAHAREVAIPLTQNPQYFDDWLRCGGTWFVGVNLLPNDGQGQLPDGPVLAGPALDFLRGQNLLSPLDRAQISAIYPGYPQPSLAESAAAFRFRRDRDAAHVDGLLAIGPDKRRHLHEPHGFVLGLPLTDATASPMVVWEGSHLIMRAAFRERLDGVPPEHWAAEDLTDTYQAARKQCFKLCKRIKIKALPGEAYVIDRLTLHGVAPWEDGETAPPEGRIIAYFRPELDDIAAWLA